MGHNRHTDDTGDLLPKGWARAWSDRKGRWYYHHKKRRGISQWSVPSCAAPDTVVAGPKRLPGTAPKIFKTAMSAPPPRKTMSVARSTCNFVQSSPYETAARAPYVPSNPAWSEARPVPK